MATIDLFREKLKQTSMTKTKIGKRKEKGEEKRKYVCLGRLDYIFITAFHAARDC